jgi:hypothetical protein
MLQEAEARRRLRYGVETLVCDAEVNAGYMSSVLGCDSLSVNNENR